MKEQFMFLDQNFYKNIQTLMEKAKRQASHSVNHIMVKTYWQIGKMIVEKQGGNERTQYGKGLIKELSIIMSQNYGRSFSKRNLEMMRQFYLYYPNANALRSQLSWTHYHSLLKVKDENARNFYIEENIKGNWSTRELERQIHSQYYVRKIKNIQMT